MSTSSVVLSAVPFAAGVAAAVPLARGAMARRRAQRAGRAYELAENYRPALARAAASVAVLVTGIALTLTLAGETGGPTATVTSAPAPPAPAPPRHGTPHRPQAAPPASSSPEPASTPSPSATPTPATPPSTEGGTSVGTLQRFADGTRVWLPPQYTYPSAARRTFPLVVAYVPDSAADRDEVFAAFAGHVEAGKADPFLVVLPTGCDADPRAAADLADRYYRTVPGTGARGLLGVGPLAPCALREAFAHSERFGAYAGVAGTYDSGPRALPAAAPAPNLLLTAATRETPQRASALRLRTALRGLGVRARLVDGVAAERALGGGGRRHELALAEQYFTEELAAPGGIARISHP